MRLNRALHACFQAATSVTQHLGFCHSRQSAPVWTCLIRGLKRLKKSEMKAACIKPKASHSYRQTGARLTPLTFATGACFCLDKTS